MKRFIAFSGGVESRTLCVLYGDKVDAAIFADTGAEHDEMYEKLNLFGQQIKEIHPDFKVIRVRNNKWKTLTNYIKHSKYFPSFNQRFCTRMFKIEPIDDFLKQFKEEGVELMIGLNADEGDQRTGNHGLLPFVKYTYPLYENGINRAMCKNILSQLNIAPNFPVYMQRGGCKYCYYKSKKEYRAFVLLAPDEFDGVIDVEESIQDERKQYFSIRDGIPNMREFKEQVQSQGLLFDSGEVYAVVNDVTSCGVFCNR